MKWTMHIALLLAALLPLLAQAQLKPTPAPTATRTVTLPSPSRPQADDNSPTAANARLQERLQQPDLPDKPVPSPRQALQPVARPVYDREGKPVNGMRQTGPNRVLDTRTGRYYSTVPSGDGQRIVY